MDTDIIIREELRPAVVSHKTPVVDEDGFTTCMEVTRRRRSVTRCVWPLRGASSWSTETAPATWLTRST